MQKAKDYLSLKGWKADLGETISDIKEMGILARRALGLSHYGFKNGGEMTSREQHEDLIRRACALWFDNNEQEFHNYGMNYCLPLGRPIDYRKDARRDEQLIQLSKFS